MKVVMSEGGNEFQEICERILARRLHASYSSQLVAHCCMGILSIIIPSNQTSTLASRAS